jgi:hypothetical protein
MGGFADRALPDSGFAPGGHDARIPCISIICSRYSVSVSGAEVPKILVFDDGRRLPSSGVRRGSAYEKTEVQTQCVGDNNP